MKRAIVPFLLAMFASHVVRAQEAKAPQVMHDAALTLIATFPYDEDVDLVPSPDGRLLYYSSPRGVYAYNRATKQHALVAAGVYGAIAISRSGDRLAVTRAPNDVAVGFDRFGMVWTIALNRATGRAASEPRKVSLSAADGPSFSPDGRSMAFIAQGPPRRVVVMPAEGGPERVLVEGGGLPSPAHTDWSPDGRWIYFGRRAEAGSTKPVAIARVASDSGPVTFVTPPVVAAFPGVSKDGRYFGVVANIDSVDQLQMSVFDDAKRETASARIKSPVIGGTIPWSVWLEQPNHAVVAVVTGDGYLAAHPTDGGADRRVPLRKGEWSRLPAMSPDGKRIAAYVSDSAPWTLVVMDLDGRNRRSFGPVRTLLGELSWSPDGRYLIFLKDGPQSLWVVEVATGKTTKVATVTGRGFPDARWMPDSRTIRTIHVDSVAGGPRFGVFETTVTGGERLLRDLTSVVVGASPGLRFVSDSTVYAATTGHVIPLTGAPRRLFDTLTTGPAHFRPASPADNRWIAEMTADWKAARLYNLDGSVRSTIPLPFVASQRFRPTVDPTGRFLAILSDGKDQSQTTLYLVPTDGGTPKVAVSLPPKENLTDFFFAPDGRSLIYGKLGPRSMFLYDADLGPRKR